MNHEDQNLHEENVDKEEDEEYENEGGRLFVFGMARTLSFILSL